VFGPFHYQNNFEMNYSSAIWWRHLPAACNNFFEAGVSGNTHLKSAGNTSVISAGGRAGMRKLLPNSCC
jgi:hypothetical protein